tara:strand:+ start:940 stop:1539 length:600 start_codon:yes stop_codon:yes gene_type:complete
MVKFKKQNLSLVLGILLLILMYKTPLFLKEFSNQPLGKLILVCLLAYFALDCDIACAILFASIIVVLLHDTKEGFKEGARFTNGKLRKFLKSVDKNATNAQGNMGFRTREGMAEGDGHTHGDDDHKHKKKKEDDDEEEEEDEDDKQGMMNDDQEGFIGLNNIKNVTDKLQNYLGFSITDLDRFMKTSSEKNTIASTKDH